MKRMEFLIEESNRLTVCDQVADEVYGFIRSLIKDNKECLRYRLAVEDCLLKWLDKSAVGHKLTVIMKKPFFGAPYIRLHYDGPRLNPLETIDDEYEYSTRLVLGLTPLYSYRRKENSVHFDIKSAGTSSFKKLAAILVLAVVIGYIGVLTVPENILYAIVTNVLSPINGVFLNALSCIAGPMIFLSVSLGIYGIGDTSTLSKIGSTMMKIFIRNDFLAGIMCVLLFPVCGLAISNGNSGTSQFSSIFQMILDIVPSNIVDPFSTGNTLQIIFLAFAVGMALLFLGKKTSSIINAVNQINYLLQFLMEIISGLVPYFVFIVIVSLFWSGDVKIMASTWKFFACLLSAMTVFSSLLLGCTAIKNKVSVSLVFEKCLPSFLIALTTASSAATFSTNVEICRRKLGIDDSVINFGIPLGMVINNPMAVINNVTVSFFFAAQAGVECSVVWLISAIFVSTVLAIASPPIPGGGAIIYTMLFLQLGIPSDLLALVFAIDLISDFVITAFEMLCLSPTLLDVSTAVGMTDVAVLQKKVI